jgi:hypothetical protein
MVVMVCEKHHTAGKTVNNKMNLLCISLVSVYLNVTKKSELMVFCEEEIGNLDYFGTDGKIISFVVFYFDSKLWSNQEGI